MATGGCLTGAGVPGDGAAGVPGGEAAGVPVGEAAGVPCGDAAGVPGGEAVGVPGGEAAGVPGGEAPDGLTGWPFCIGNSSLGVTLGGSGLVGGSKGGGTASMSPGLWVGL